jgi:hypothetical protein
MNLVETSALVKRILSGIIVLSVVVAIYLVIKPIVVGSYRTIFPPKDLPNIAFGKLDPLEFIEKPIVTTNPQFTLDTTTGRLPTAFPKKMEVYKVKKDPFNYSAGKEAQEHAGILGFTDDELITDLKGDTYGWRDRTGGGILEINIGSKEMSLTTPLLGKAGFFKQGAISTTRAIPLAQEMLHKIDRLDDELYLSGIQQTTLGRINGGEIIETSTVNLAELARVDFFRQVNGYDIVGPDPTKGLINVTLRNPENSDVSLNYPFIEYRQWSLVLPNDTEYIEATYPIIPVSTAWDAVANQNKGVVVSVTPLGTSIFTKYEPAGVDRIFVKDIKLAYYDNAVRQNYLQPIYVFEGNYNVNNQPGGNIVIYFPAVDGSHIN